MQCQKFDSSLFTLNKNKEAGKLASFNSFDAKWDRIYRVVHSLFCSSSELEINNLVLSYSSKPTPLPYLSGGYNMR